MSDEIREVKRDEQIGLDSAEAFEITTEGASVTGRHLYADGGDGKEKEVVILSPHAGASSEAPAASGIPSAMSQSHAPRGAAAVQDETPMEDRIIPVRQNLEP